MIERKEALTHPDRSPSTNDADTGSSKDTPGMLHDGMNGKSR